MHRQQRLWTNDLVLIERTTHAGNRALARRVPDEQLRDHRVVAIVDLATLLHARLDADARTTRRSMAEQLARRWRKAVARILRVDTTLDRMPTHDDVGLRKRQRLTRRDEDLLAHKIDTRNELGDGMLDLNPRVHLEEKEIAMPIEQALDGARADVADGLSSRDRHRTHPRPQLLVDGRRWGLLDDLLMPTLQRAIALTEVHRRAVRVGHHLDLDVPRILDVLLDVDRAVAKPGLALALGGLEQTLGIASLVHNLETATTTTSRGLEGYRPAVLLAQLDDADGVRDLLGRARHDRHTSIGHQDARVDLRAHRIDRARRRTNPDQASLLDRSRKRSALGKKAVARMDRLRTRARGRVDQLGDIEVALARRGGAKQHGLVGVAHVRCTSIGLGIDGDRLDAELAAGTKDADGNLATVRNQDAIKRRRHRASIPLSICSRAAC